MAKKSKTTNDQQHIKKLHGHRLIWFFVLAVGLLSLHFVSNLQASNSAVLAYATNVSHGELASLTNQKRAANGLGALTLHSQLNSAAQGKANHMVANNYWAHTAPDGTEPWYFFDQAGYPYVHAGENLAYGFDSSAEIIDAWMNSAGHRANILGDYKDVGFGFTNGANYQGGQYTVVVAFYGTQSTPSPPPPPPASTPAAPIQPTPTPTPQPEPEPVVSEEKPVATAEPEPVESKPDTNGEAPVNTEASKRVTNLDNLLSGNGSWILYGSLSLVGVTSVGFGATHMRLVRRGWKKSAHFILVHPLIDLAAIGTIVAIVLASTAGFIR